MNVNNKALFPLLEGMQKIEMKKGNELLVQVT